MPVFAAFAEAYQARWTVVRMWYEGWNKQSIAGCPRSHAPMSIRSWRPSRGMASPAWKSSGLARLSIPATN